MEPKRHFAPVADARTRVLILGSLPGEASLAAGQYYAHPRNAFWPLAGAVAEVDLVPLPYPERLAALRQASIGLWDVVARAERVGSLDSAIRAPVHADLPTQIAALPELRAIAFNGGKAAMLGRKILTGVSGPALIDLPSSSPAFAKPLAWKAERWALLREFLPAR